MTTTDKEYMDLHLLWRSEIEGKPVKEEIDESVFEDIIRLQEGEDGNVPSKNRTRWL